MANFDGLFAQALEIMRKVLLFLVGY
ncbi:threonine dehydratase [Reinekea blandensis MED297]|uniref:Threonine dehydratase n=1 Tax=Reinekea blandensis MED297 TaxID=314283 RepID=A4BDM1_9GAMM|nr:threonine dehydratase [Reinekea blandensis MED297]